MSHKNSFAYSILARKLLVLGSFILIASLGVQYRPTLNFNYQEVKAIEKNGIINVDFDFLSGFDCENAPTPKQVKDLNGKKVLVTGFMLPVDFEEGKVTTFLLLKNQMGCCFGITPRMNEFIYVKMKGDLSTKFMTDIPITVLGKFGVGQDNMVGSLYVMEAEQVQLSKNF